MVVYTHRSGNKPHHHQQLQLEKVEVILLIETINRMLLVGWDISGGGERERNGIATLMCLVDQVESRIQGHSDILLADAGQVGNVVG